MGERGSTSVWLLAMAALVTAAAVLAAAVAGAVTVRHRAAAAADLAALAGAGTAVSGGDACAMAARVVTANAARLTRCQVQGVVVEVTARVIAHGWLTRFGVGSVRSARAGPVTAATLPSPR
jgi:secretion/DNA translocation related TadE-like protein